MRPLSALEAISPAWSHTSRLLWEKRSWRTMLKIGIIACFAEVGASFNSNFNSNSLSNALNSGNAGNSPFSGGHAITPGALAIVASVLLIVVPIFLLISLIFFYIDSRLQFVLFEVVLRNDTTVGPIWSRYGAATWRWMGLKLMFFIACLLLCLPLLIPAVVQFVHLAGGQGSTSDHPAALIISMVAVFGAIGVIVLLFSLFYMFIYDFGLPAMALESTSVSQTLSRVWSVLRAEPGQSLLYLVMRIVLGFAGGMAASFGIFFAVLIACIPIGLLAVLDVVILKNAGTGGHVIMVLVLVVLGIAFFAAIFIAGFIIMGYLLTFIQAYALYFLGGRYPLLGQYLAPYWPATHMPVPPPTPPTPPAPSTFNPPIV